MSETTGISWTDHTFNPWWGCAKVSPGCNHCYADTLASRYGFDVWGKTKPRRLFGDKYWAEPHKWNAQAQREGKRHRVFCASMADVFEDRPDLESPRAQLGELIVATPNLDWQLLTKRPENVESMVPWGYDWPPNVWLGTSVEDEQRATERVPVLLQIYGPAVRFLSVEPLIGPVQIRCDWLQSGRLHWVIVGGESGFSHRPMDPEWLRRVVDHTHQHGIPVFVKQDSGPRPGQQSRIPDRLWALKEFPT